VYGVAALTDPSHKTRMAYMPGCRLPRVYESVATCVAVGKTDPALHCVSHASPARGTTCRLGGAPGERTRMRTPSACAT
jgi:hypothetical protein